MKCEKVEMQNKGNLEKRLRRQKYPGIAWKWHSIRHWVALYAGAVILWKFIRQRILLLLPMKKYGAHIWTNMPYTRIVGSRLESGGVETLREFDSPIRAFFTAFAYFCLHKEPVAELMRPTLPLCHSCHKKSTESNFWPPSFSHYPSKA